MEGGVVHCDDETAWGLKAVGGGEGLMFFVFVNIRHSRFGARCVSSPVVVESVSTSYKLLCDRRVGEVLVGSLGGVGGCGRRWVKAGTRAFGMGEEVDGTGYGGRSER